jgi:hypothetical protein
MGSAWFVGGHVGQPVRDITAASVRMLFEAATRSLPYNYALISPYGLV